MTPLVSVLMPSYQHEAYIAEAIESVLKQSFRQLELIVIDDGSTDRSPSIIRALAKQDARIRPIFHEVQCGIPTTFNDGLAAARGKFVAVLASDDIWLEHKLEKQMEVLQANDDLVVWCEGNMVDEHCQPTGKLAVHGHINNGVNTTKSGDILSEILRGGLIRAQNLVGGGLA